jgi:hypothetical protein
MFETRPGIGGPGFLFPHTMEPCKNENAAISPSVILYMENQEFLAVDALSPAFEEHDENIAASIR